MDIVKRYTYLDFNNFGYIAVEKTNTQRQVKIGFSGLL